MRLWQAAEAEAVNVFAANLKDLLLAAPAGQRATMGLDPGFRTGVKVAVVDSTGKVVATHTIYPHVPQHKWDESLFILKNLAEQHHVELIAIGNGTASRETDKLAVDLIKANPELNLTKIVVSEAGASVYSASAYASSELPELDVSLRGAVSIARRLQDPLAELVKIDPKSIGVGQYQHDVTGTKLERSLDAVVEDAVNAVGVDVNTASRPLLARVSGITDSLAGAIVAHRDAARRVRDPRAAQGRPAARPQGVRAVRGLPAHPRRRRPARRLGRAPRGVPGGPPDPGQDQRRRRDPDRQHQGRCAASTRPSSPTRRSACPRSTTSCRELEKPGRDPRPEFQTATFAEGVQTLGDLEPGMVLEGVVTNVAAFGAFVDIGVHQDGLVHVSAMSDNFVADPRDVAKSGDVVKVKVLSVDIPRNRISLTMRLKDEGEAGAREGGPRGCRRRARGRRPAPAGERPGGSRTSAADPGRARLRPARRQPRGRRPRRRQAQAAAAGDRRRPGDRRGRLAATAGGRAAGAGGDRRGGAGGNARRPPGRRPGAPQVTAGAGEPRAAERQAAIPATPAGPGQRRDGRGPAPGRPRQRQGQPGRQAGPPLQPPLRPGHRQGEDRKPG